MTLNVKYSEDPESVPLLFCFGEPRANDFSILLIFEGVPHLEHGGRLRWVLLLEFMVQGVRPQDILYSVAT